MIVSNTSTLVLLAKIGCLEQFIMISPPIEIPSQVKEESLFYPESYYALLIHKLITQGKINVTKVEEKNIRIIMSQFRLDKGEAAAYVLFDSSKHKAILTDDGELIKLCKLQEVPFTCALGALVRLYEKKVITKEKTLEKISQLQKIGRYSPKLIDYFKKEVQ
ncbi:MAG: hypothetical protein A2729_04925 [Candidatus Buchananbacteria bacterium RIFCSPHIGHO2_01_FULL_39_14]|uniref:DUF3368 domain-containing protein n=1 Tax=Candidatus Buchananbacteria bacterium RIFCSPHIGHO2_01_FULL_39_14 TaxID=1797532 RepID=A0A1G1XVE6_9BACT|nr:MAG: hypothetical protein A2729_04925 [Candidatus Buchananbacteria bacterium RIFCSPHIGHO2_01_FULL_39_14]